MDDTTVVVERWLPVVGWEAYYEVSDQGRVRSLDRIVVETTGRARRHYGRILRPSKDRHGYRRVLFSVHRVETTILVHHLVLEAFIEPRPPGMYGLHGSGDCTDNRPSNLRWGTQGDNMLDKIRHGNDHNSNRTHCPEGHRLVMPNLIPSASKQGHRNCLACNRANGNATYAKRKGRPYDLTALKAAHYARIMRGQGPGISD